MEERQLTEIGKDELFVLPDYIEYYALHMAKLKCLRLFDDIIECFELHIAELKYFGFSIFF